MRHEPYKMVMLFILFRNAMLLTKKSIVKASAGHNTVTYAILVPDEEDRNGDVIDANEIVKTAHEFMLNVQNKTVNFDHTDGTDTDMVKFVESYVTPVDITLDNGNKIQKGTRLVAFKFVDENLFKKVLTGEIVGVSME